MVMKMSEREKETFHFNGIAALFISRIPDKNESKQTRNSRGASRTLRWSLLNNFLTSFSRQLFSQKVPS